MSNAIFYIGQHMKQEGGRVYTYAQVGERAASKFFDYTGIHDKQVIEPVANFYSKFVQENKGIDRYSFLNGHIVAGAKSSVIGKAEPVSAEIGCRIRQTLDDKIFPDCSIN
jgi:hypothetical protein